MVFHLAYTSFCRLYYCDLCSRVDTKLGRDPCKVSSVCVSEMLKYSVSQKCKVIDRIESLTDCRVVSNKTKN